MYSTQTKFQKVARFTFEDNINKPTDLTFDLNSPHTYCRICGDIFQTPQDRQKNQSKANVFYNTERRKNWSKLHAKTHTEREHLGLAISGLWVTADAAYKLESYGIHAIGSAILSKSVEAALREAPNTPQNDVEGSR